MPKPSDQPPHDQRTSRRVSLARPAKVFHVPTQRYLAAQTCDLSDGGALLQVHSLRRLNIGDRVEVMVQWSTRAILSASDHVKARVVRAMTADHAQLIAIQFETGAMAAEKAA